MRMAIGFGAALAVALLMTSVPAQAADPIKMTLCTASASGLYFESGNILKGQARGVIDINVEKTNGSWDNLERIVAGTCDAAIIQADAYGVFRAKNPGSKLAIRRVTTLYQEHVHLVCRKDAGIDRVTQLKPGHTILVGDNGSGSQVTWQSLVNADKKRYEPIAPFNESGDIAIAKLLDKDGGATCMIFVAGLNTQSMKDVNSFALDSRKKQVLALVAFDDGDLKNIKDPSGNQVYTYDEIPKGTYPNLQAGSLYGTNSVATITQPAVLVVSDDWATKNKEGLQKLTGFTLRAKPHIANALATRQR
jgi:TRAP transporter TAXI family solute receptor